MASKLTLCVCVAFEGTATSRGSCTGLSGSSGASLVRGRPMKRYSPPAWIVPYSLISFARCRKVALLVPKEKRSFLPA